MAHPHDNLGAYLVPAKGKPKPSPSDAKAAGKPKNAGGIAGKMRAADKKTFSKKPLGGK